MSRHPSIMSRHPSISLLSGLLSLALLACGQADQSNTESAAPKSDLPERFALATEPPSPQNVSQVRTAAKSGDDVVVIGRVGGAKKVFLEGTALFTLVDSSIQPCGVGKMDDCKTPWDYCCDDPSELVANTVTVEFADGGQLLKANVRGFHGLDHLRTVVVKGKAKKDEAGNVTVLADGIFVRS